MAVKTIMPDVSPLSPTSLPAYERRPVCVAVAIPQSKTLPAMFRAAARLIAANGHHQGDYVPDPFDRIARTSHAERPMSIVAALRCVVSGSPHLTTALADQAVSVLAWRLEVGGRGPVRLDDFSLECHVADWGDVEGRTTESVVAVLYAAADASEVTA